MGNNQSLPPNSSGFLNPNFTTGNVAEPSLLDDDSLVDDLTEDQFIGVIQAIINKDEGVQDRTFNQAVCKELLRSLLHFVCICS